MRDQNAPPRRQSPPKQIRKVKPADIALPPGYRIEVFAAGLTTPINIMFAADGTMLAADAGVTSGSGKVLQLTKQGFETMAAGFNPPLTGINEYQGNIYVAHRGAITVIKRDGTRENILAGLPSWGDHHNNRMVFGPDGKMYFGQGTATNSGVVGEDNRWAVRYPSFHDIPGAPLTLTGQNFTTKNFLAAAPYELASTGAFSPYGVSTRPGEVVTGAGAASGSILRANPDGSRLELVAWGLRNPFRIRFDRRNRLYAANHGMDVRGSRPVANAPDEFQLIVPGMWYGWPDYSGGLPVTSPLFKPEGQPQPAFLLAHPPMQPPRPFVNFTPHAAAMGFDFNDHPGFAPLGDAFIAEFGAEAPGTTGGELLPGVGHRISRIEMRTGKKTPFAINKSGFAASQTGGGGLERPIDVLFGPDGAMYVADFGQSEGESGWIPGSGVIWRIVRE